MMSKEAVACDIFINCIGGFLGTMSLFLETTVADVKAAILQETNVLAKEQALLIGTEELGANGHVMEILLEDQCSFEITLIRQHP